MWMLTFSKIVLNFAKVLLVGSLGIIVFMVVVGIFAIGHKVNEIAKPIVNDVCKDDPTLGMCTPRPADSAYGK